jgi:two-component system, sensor histidine kinase RpfC
MKEHDKKSLKAMFKDRPDTELEQSAMRIVILFLLTGYFYYFRNSINQFSHLSILMPIATSVALGFFILTSLSNNISMPRRFISIFLDMSVLSYMIYLTDYVGLPLIFIYLWISFGNGFRFGNKCLLMSVMFSIIGFSLVLTYNEYWQGLRSLGYGVIFALITLSLYVSFLITKLHTAADEAKAANLAKSQFLENMSHEIRTPLNGVIGMSSLLSNTELNSKQNEFASTINVSAKTLLALINDILDISKIEAGKMTTESVDFDLYALINSIAMMFFAQTARKGLVFNTHISPETPFLLHGDKQHLRQIIINLIGNAIKFTNQGSIEIFVAPVESTHSHVTIKFEIIDTGIGIADKDKSKIFDKFTQADNSITRNYGGTGLGMTIAKQLVENMNGNISFTSKLEAGSNFWCEITFKKKEILAEENKLLTSLNDATLLLVNAQREYSKIIEDNLATWGMSLDYANSADETFDKILDESNKNQSYNIILIFNKYLDTNAIQLIQQIKSRANHMNHAFILVNNRCLSDANNAELLKAGYNSIIKSDAERHIIYRALHASVAGINITGLGSKTDYVAKLDTFNKFTNRKLNILVGEDNATNQKVIQNILEYGHHKVTLADNGEIVLDMLENNRFDLIILDMHMPVMSGLEAAKIFRFMCPDKADTPIIMLTANATPEAIKACKEAKIDAYLTKPIEPNVLLQNISLLTGDKNNNSETYKKPLNVSRITGSDNDSILETEVLETLYKMAPENNFMRVLINDYLRDVKNNINQIILSMHTANFKEIADLSHTVDGSSRSIGAKKLSTEADRIFKLAQSGQQQAIKNMIGDLEHIYEETAAALEGFIDHKKSA